MNIFEYIAYQQYGSWSEPAEHNAPTSGSGFICEVCGDCDPDCGSCQADISDDRGYAEWDTEEYCEWYSPQELKAWAKTCNWTEDPMSDC